MDEVEVIRPISKLKVVNMSNGGEALIFIGEDGVMYIV